MVNRRLPEKLSISLRLGFLGYRFGIGFYGIEVWDCVLWDKGLGLGSMGYGFGIGLYGI